MSNTLLVIDDSPTVRKLVELSFANKPWQLFFAASGREGMTLSERVRPEVVLLDYVLPDMNGTDVCAELVRRGLDGLRVVLMTAKEERIRTQFASYPMVVDYVTKPFTAELVVGKATSALQKPRGGAPRSTGSTLGAQGDDQRHALGQALYAVLRGKLNDAPQWLRESPGTAPGPMLARRLLTDETLASVAAELGPLSRYAPIAAPPAKQSLPSEGVLNALDLIEVLSRKRKTGVLTIESDAVGDSWRCLMQGGRLLLVTHRDPRTDLRLAHQAGLGMSIPEDISPEAEVAHASLEAPILLSLRQAPESLSNMLSAVVTSALVDILGKAKTRTSWEESQALGALALSTLPGISITQLRLSIQRSLPDPDSQPVNASDWVGRPPGFSAKVVHLQLSDEERAVLTLASEPISLGDVAARVKFDESTMLRTAQRLLAVGLLERTSERPTPRVHPRIALAEPDQETRSSLAALLGTHLPEVELLVHTTLAEMKEGLRLRPAQLVLVNVSDDVAAAKAYASAARAEAAPPSKIVAVLDRADPEVEAELPVCGFDGVLVKPLLLDEVIALYDGA